MAFKMKKHPELLKVVEQLRGAVKAHGNQKRASGDPYSVHPIEVANILTDLKLDSATITTGLLHDTVEDTRQHMILLKKNLVKKLQI